MLYSLLYRDKLYSDGELMTDIDSTSLPPMTCESNYFYFRSLIFQYDEIVSFNSSPPSLQIPPLTLLVPNGRPGQGAFFFLKDKEIIVTYFTTREHVFKQQELRYHIV